MAMHFLESLEFWIFVWFRSCMETKLAWCLLGAPPFFGGKGLAHGVWRCHAGELHGIACRWCDILWQTQVPLAGWATCARVCACVFACTTWHDHIHVMTMHDHLHSWTCISNFDDMWSKTWPWVSDHTCMHVPGMHDHTWPYHAWLPIDDPFSYMFTHCLEDYFHASSWNACMLSWNEILHAYCHMGRWNVGTCSTWMWRHVQEKSMLILHRVTKKSSHECQWVIRGMMLSQHFLFNSSGAKIPDSWYSCMKEFLRDLLTAWPQMNL